ncbi:response regulator [Candidatus Bathyarchaeota archaeon]|nr:response regulator [Candidatus Bathyarchaeota archaeon]
MTAEGILLIDDDSDILCSFKSILEDEGYRVYTASDAKQAIEILREQEIKLAILDYVMPNMRGDQLAKAINALDDGINIIFVSGYTEVIEAASRLDFDVYDVLLKPLDPDRLINKIRALRGVPKENGQLFYAYPVATEV